MKTGKRFSRIPPPSVPVVLQPSVRRSGELHDGVIRTSSRGGLVLVANDQLATEVLTDDDLFSVSEYRMRMQESIGDIYLGHDSKDEQYKRWSSLPNEAIGNVTEVDAFRAARAETAAALTRALERRVQETVRLSLEDIIDDVLAKAVCRSGLVSRMGA